MLCKKSNCRVKKVPYYVQKISVVQKNKCCAKKTYIPAAEVTPALSGHAGPLRVRRHLSCGQTPLRAKKK